jgi:hypothetical protein
MLCDVSMHGSSQIKDSNPYPTFKSLKEIWFIVQINIMHSYLLMDLHGKVLTLLCLSCCESVPGNLIFFVHALHIENRSRMIWSWVRGLSDTTGWQVFTSIVSEAKTDWCKCWAFTLHKHPTHWMKGWGLVWVRLPHNPLCLLSLLAWSWHCAGIRRFPRPPSFRSSRFPSLSCGARRWFFFFFYGERSEVLDASRWLCFDVICHDDTPVIEGGKV